MNNDLKIYMNDYKFKVRVAGIIISDNYLLVESYSDVAYTLPGGHIEINETSERAIKRELEEELNINIEIEKFVGLIENFFVNIKNEKTHCLDFFYKCSIKIDDYNNFEMDEIDHGIKMHHSYKWIKIDELDKYNLKPNTLINIIKDNNYEQIFHVIQQDKRLKDN